MLLRTNFTFRSLGILAILLLGPSCSIRSIRSSIQPAIIISRPETTIQNKIDEIEPKNLTITTISAPVEDDISSDKIIEEAVASSEQKIKIPVEINEHVEQWINYYTVQDRVRFQRFLNRGQLCKDIVENVLEENDLPAELYYLAMIESGYRTDAHSHASAVGVWQFIAGTAQRYGLRIDNYVDERRDPKRATEAAAKYLRDLYNVFGSWHLAMAAYNAGEIRVLRAVFKGRTRNFWELVQSKVLPKRNSQLCSKIFSCYSYWTRSKEIRF